VLAFERASGRDLQGWARAWVERRGLPVVRLSWEADSDGHVTDATLSQRDVLDEGGVWPMRTQLLLMYPDGTMERVTSVLESASVPVPELLGKPAPLFIFANDGDFGYGLFLPDARSRAALLQHIGEVEDGFLRALLWDALWESVRQAELAPLEYLDLALRELPNERDEITAGGLLARVQTVFRWYLSPTQQTSVAARLESALREGMLHAPDPGLRITWFRSFAALASTDQGRSDLKRLLLGELTIPGVTLSSNERFRIIRRLLALSDPSAQALLTAQSEADQTDEGRRQAYAAGAARADARVKQDYFNAYLRDRQLAERWVEESLGPFNAVEQEMLTLPFLQMALQSLPQLKHDHKIFFVNNWLAAFIGGQRTAEALQVVQQYLQRTDLQPDLRLKVLEAVDALERTVAIRGRYAR
jgi:aminopeptidase N